MKRVKARLARDKYRERVFGGQIQASAKFETDKDIFMMREVFNSKFFELFETAF